MPMYAQETAYFRVRALSMTSVFILGSCATRDALEIRAAEGVTLADYVARTSFASLASQPLLQASLLPQIKSSFQRRMVERDMAKSFWSILDRTRFDLLVVDLIDDRFRLRCFADGSAHTVSAEYAQAVNCVADGATQERVQDLVNDAPRFRELWKNGARRLSKTLKDMGKSDRIVVNCVFHAYTRNPATNAWVDQANAYLRWAYADLKWRFPQGHFITYPEGLLQSDPHHQWGEAPFHYKEAVYVHFIAQLKAVAGQMCALSP